MMIRLALAFASIAALGCQKKASPPAEGSGSATATATSAPCNDAINKAIDGMIAKRKSQGSDQVTPERQERFERMRATLGTRCAEDHWPDAMLTCVATVTGQPELMKCMQEALTPDASQRLQADIAKVMFGMRRNGAGGPGQGPGSGNFHAHDFDVAGAYEKRLADLAIKIDETSKMLVAATTDADRATAKAELERLNAEKQRIERDLGQIKATHGRDLKDTTPSTVVPSSGSGSGSAANPKK
jgi:hypothetical protein